MLSELRWFVFRTLQHHLSQPSDRRRYATNLEPLVDFTLGVIRARPADASIALAAWLSYADSRPDLVDSVCRHLNGTVFRPNAKDLNIDGQQAVILWWSDPGVVTVHFTIGHWNLATSTADAIATALGAQFVPVTAHFTEIQQMIADVGDHVAIIKFRSDSSIDRLAIIEHTTVVDGESLYLHYLDSESFSASPMTRVSVDDIVSISSGKYRRCDF